MICFSAANTSDRSSFARVLLNSCRLGSLRICWITSSDSSLSTASDSLFWRRSRASSELFWSWSAIRSRRTCYASFIFKFKRPSSVISWSSLRARPLIVTSASSVLREFAGRACLWAPCLSVSVGRTGERTWASLSVRIRMWGVSMAYASGCSDCTAPLCYGSFFPHRQAYSSKPS